MSLSRLPQELIELIVANVIGDNMHKQMLDIKRGGYATIVPESVTLHHRQRQTTLYLLTLTSRALYHGVNPLLYSSIHWTWSRDPQAPQHQLELLLRTLLSRPDLASLVKYVHFDSWNIPRKDGILWTKFTPTEIQLLYEAIAHFSELRKQDGLEMLGDTLFPSELLNPNGRLTDSGDALAAITIWLMKGLRHLSLDADYEYHSYSSYGARDLPVYVWEMMRVAVNSNPPRFPHLVNVRYNCLRYGGEKQDAIPEYLLPIFSLSSLQKLALALPDHGPCTHPLMLPPDTQSLPNLSSLTLANSDFDLLRTILSVAPNLTTLHYTVLMHIPSFSNYLDANKLREILVTGAPQLRELTVAVDCEDIDHFDDGKDWAEAFGDECGIEGTLGPLTGLTQLDVFEVSLTTLLLGPISFPNLPPLDALADMLPHSLRELRLGFDWYEFSLGSLPETYEIAAWLVEGLLRAKERGEWGSKGALEKIVLVNEVREPDDTFDVGWEGRYADNWPREGLKECCERYGMKYETQERRAKSFMLYHTYETSPIARYARWSTGFPGRFH